MRRNVRVFMLGITLFLIVSTIGARAGTVEASAASAFGVKADTDLLDASALSIPATPFAGSPREADGSDEDSNSVVGPVRVPSNGSLVSDIRALYVAARRTNAPLPTAHAEARTGHAALFEQDGAPLVEVDALHAVADAKCTGGDEASTSAEGSQFVKLVVDGRAFDTTPPKNTEVSLVFTGDAETSEDDMGIRLILNEQTGANEGTGLMVTMIHAIVFSPSDPNLVFADLRIATAKATVFCGSGTQSTAGNPDDRDISSDQAASGSATQGVIDIEGIPTAHRGDEVTWTITIRNEGSAACSLVEITDTLPRHFTFAGSTGDLTAEAQPTVEGRTVRWSNAARWDLPAGESLVERVTATVDDDAPFGTYTTLLEVDQSTCSSFTQGLRGPVEIISQPAARTAAGQTPADSSGSDTRVRGERTLATTGFAMATHVAVAVALLSLGALSASFLSPRSFRGAPSGWRCSGRLSGSTDFHRSREATTQ